MFSCESCEITFAFKSSLIRHNLKQHGKSVVGKIACSECTSTFTTNQAVITHLKNVHEIPIEVQTFTFLCEEDFLNWKAKVEEEECSYYTQERGSQQRNESQVAKYFRCNRSGNYKPEITSRKRQQKKGGSVKSGKYCPASIKYLKTTIDDVDEITVHYVSTHVGHHCEPEKLRLSTRERDILAGKLQQGLPKSKVLAFVNDFSGSPSQRLSFTTRADLNNILLAYKIKNTEILNPKDAESIEGMVHKMMNVEDNPIILYKPQGEELSDSPGLLKDDFILGIMNDAQCSVLSMFGDNIIQITTIHGTNVYGFYLTLVMVDDNNEEGFPVAVLYSSQQTTEVFIRFFGAIKEHLQVVNAKIKPTVFIVDDEPVFYDAWKAVFEEVPNHLLYSEHVINDWNCNRLTKIETLECQEMVSQQLEEMQNQSDPIHFEHLLNSYSEKWIGNEDTKLFGLYFKDNYENRSLQWAHCYRKNLEVNINIMLEKWHSEIKQPAQNGKVIKRLDKSVHIVMSLISRKLISHAVQVHKEKIVSKVAALWNRHKRSIGVQADAITYHPENNLWIVKSSKSSKVLYKVCRTESTCFGQCNVKCEFCFACIHQYSCTCHDYIICFQMCKHIHQVLQLYPVTSSIEGQSELVIEEELDIPVDDVDIDNDNCVTVATDYQKEHNTYCLLSISEHYQGSVTASISERKENFIATYQNIISKLDHVTTTEQFDVIEGLQQAILANIESFMSQTHACQL